MNYLLAAALLPVVALLYFIYQKDSHKEPKNVLTKLFVSGCLTVIPILFFELFLGELFPTDDVYDFLTLFINVFFSVAIVEEGFKWIVVKIFGYDNHEFDEIYDIIVYSVFASLGFACIENIVYVFTSGFGTAIIRAITAVPGHTCFAVAMGYFMSKAKVNAINKQNSLAMQNLILSLLVPTLLHTCYDAIVMYAVTIDSGLYVGLFYLFIIIMFCICFVVVDRISKVQHNVSLNINNGNITYQKGNVSMNTMEINREAIQKAANNSIPEKAIPQSASDINSQLNFCPICGKPTHGANYCGFCGYRLKD